MKWPFVSRGRFEDMREARDQWRRRGDLLEEHVVTMRKEGFSPLRPAKITQPPPEPGERQLKEAEATYVANAVSAAQRARPGISPSDAKAEARRLREQATDEHL